ncbi:6-phospho 3-hexuloisomerase [Virgibacillus pantothenticus]|uniref:6-phospho 3-hexuloisomerase n=1 Tax=Virgibacillus pantothenticus TaxID=1473 RepID=A0A0L0QRU6_VIRPA|nr:MULTISPECIES: 6-phospho-3-hexuloisomerase [Virgibacillus]API91999.1 6-phospho 3-hexuloisomerase [Virgibacillus sp. 6R]KNE21370.1 6-phospho 3-hexuloisomerase [Virgibacillus pantothenticus]MBS7430458.1 6-phospho-3-hexuloisomerase [Virgibacillus sp. 19R1-5]MBU8566396.1 6-phospho-3-hexuloisomerase [Virgibacillus pantothenticus]MBU8600188.1 6-phospho-3-hexuloisomerase [Virgibacillus pantothenticus]
MRETLDTIALEVTKVIQAIDPEETVELAKQLKRANSIFVAGTGRSGLIGKAFAIRMMHSGYSVYVVGETITPSMEADDLLLIISGSGNTGTLAYFAEKAAAIGASIALVTTNKQSIIAQYSDWIVEIPAATKKRLSKEPATIQPLGSQFDQSAHLVLDAVIAHILEQEQMQKSNEVLKTKHANLE